MKPSAIHTRVQAAIATALPTWYPSRHGHDAFVDVPDGAEISHRSYSIALPESTPLEGRQTRSTTEGQHTTTALQVRWLYRIRVEARDTDYRAALDAEIDLLRAILGVGGNSELHVQLDGPLARRELAPSTGPMLLGEMALVVHHQIALTA